MNREPNGTECAESGKQGKKKPNEAEGAGVIEMSGKKLMERKMNCRGNMIFRKQKMLKDEVTYSLPCCSFLCIQSYENEVQAISFHDYPHGPQTITFLVSYSWQIHKVR